MRRLIVEEPVSRAALGSLRAAWFALAVTGMSVWLVRGERVEIGVGFALLAVSLALALVALVLAIGGFVDVWREGRRGVGRAGFACAIAVAILAGPVAMGVIGLGLPAINDITTDLDNPPAFSQSRAVLAARGGRVPPDPGPKARTAQREAYAQIGPVLLDVSAEEAYELALETVQARGLQIVEASPPGGRSGIGRIEAVDRTLLLRFPDDVTVRVRPRADGARIDIRSASRYGSHDYGANARRIRSLAEAIATAATQPAP